MKGKKLERDVQREICEWLASKGLFFWRYNNVPIFGKSNDGRMRFRAMPKFSIKGLPDIIILHKGLFHGLEVKREGFSPTPEQYKVGKSIELAGGRYYAVHSLEEAQKLLGDFY